MKVLVTSLRLVNRLPKLKEMVPEEVEFIVPETYTDEELATLAGDVETIICVRLAEEVVRAAPKLRFIQKSGAKVDTIPFDVINERDILISNTSGANPIPVAESAMALVLALAIKIVHRHLKMAKGEVDRSRSQQLAGKAMGVLGLGSIGTEVARRALAFGMKVAAVKRHPPYRGRPGAGLGLHRGTRRPREGTGDVRLRRGRDAPHTGDPGDHRGGGAKEDEALSLPGKRG